MRPRKSVNVASLVGSPEDQPSRPNLRLRVVGILFLVLFLVLGLRLWTLQVIDGKSYAAAVTRNQVRVVDMAAPRGQIVDRNDTVLVTNVPDQELLLSRGQRDAESLHHRQGRRAHWPDAGTGERAVKNERYSPYEPVPVATNVPADTVQYLQTHQSDYPGVTVQTVTQRTYPQVGHHRHPRARVPRATSPRHRSRRIPRPTTPGQSRGAVRHRAAIRAVPARRQRKPGALGERVRRCGRTLSRTAPQIGDTVVLNIDTGLQEEVQDDLAQQIALDRTTPDAEDGNKLPPAINGAAIVINPQNGQVLAMASYPTYDLNQWVGGISTANFAALKRVGRRTTRPFKVSTRRVRPSN